MYNVVERPVTVSARTRDGCASNAPHAPALLTAVVSAGLPWCACRKLCQVGLDIGQREVRDDLLIEVLRSAVGAAAAAA